MSTNEHMCKYIDKDKILPWLDDKIEFWKEVAKEQGKKGKKAAFGAEMLVFVRQNIEMGMFDWQQGSEKIIFWRTQYGENTD